jgi:hypothetical protein
MTVLGYGNPNTGIIHGSPCRKETDLILYLYNANHTMAGGNRKETIVKPLYRLAGSSGQSKE